MDISPWYSSSKLLQQLFLLLCLSCTNYMYMPRRNSLHTNTDTPRQCGGSVKGVHPRAERGCSLAIDARHPAVTMATAASLAARSLNSHILRKTSTTWPKDKKGYPAYRGKATPQASEYVAMQKKIKLMVQSNVQHHQQQLPPLNKTQSSTNHTSLLP